MVKQWSTKKIKECADIHSTGQNISTDVERVIANKIRLALREMRDDYEAELTRLRHRIDELESGE